jgi:hypothetical protein
MLVMIYCYDEYHYINFIQMAGETAGFLSLNGPGSLPEGIKLRQDAPAAQKFGGQSAINLKLYW